MATQTPLTTPWSIIAPDTNVNDVDLSSASNLKQVIGLGGAAIAIAITAGTFLITVDDPGNADPFTAKPIPSYTAGDKLVLSLQPNQRIYYKATTASDSFAVGA